MVYMPYTCGICIYLKHIILVSCIIGIVYIYIAPVGRGGSCRADVCDNAFHAYLKRHHDYTCEPSDNREAHITHQRVQAARRRRHHVCRVTRFHIILYVARE